MENLESADAAFNQFKSFPVAHNSGALFARHNFNDLRGLHVVPSDAAALGFMPGMNERLRLGEYDHAICSMPSHMSQVQFRGPVVNSLVPHGHPTASMIKSDDPFLHSSVACSSGLIGASAHAEQFLYPGPQHHGFPGNFTAMLNDGDESGLCGLPNIQTMIHGVRAPSATPGGFQLPHGIGVGPSYHDMTSGRPTYIPESAYNVDSRSFMNDGNYKLAQAGVKGSVAPAAAHQSCSRSTNAFLERAASVPVSQMMNSYNFETSLGSPIANYDKSAERKRSRRNGKAKEMSENENVGKKASKYDGSPDTNDTIQRSVGQNNDMMQNNSDGVLNFSSNDHAAQCSCQHGGNLISSPEGLHKQGMETNGEQNEMTLNMSREHQTTDLTCIDVGSDDILDGKTTDIDICAVELKRETVDLSEAAVIEAAIEPIISDVKACLRQNHMSMGHEELGAPCSIELDIQNEGPASVWGAINVGNAIAQPITEQTPNVSADKHKYVDKLDVNVQVEDCQCVVVDGVRRWRCIQCPKIYSTKHNLIIHILGHSGIKPHCCVICNKYFKQISHLQTHMLRHGNVKPHVCHVCNRSFTQASHVKRHMSVHMERRPHVCQHCDRSFAYPCELRTHMERHKTDHSCDECGVVFETNDKLRKHRIVEHRDSSALMCKVCSKVFMYPSQLRDHMAKHEGSRPYICGECGLDFMKEHHLKAHMFIHTGLRPYECKQCAKAFNQKANLQRHMLIHTGEKKYACEICGRSFTQHQVLRAHMITHQDTKPFQCKICGKGFSRLHNLNGHMHIHEGDKPFICQCGAAFTLKGNLNRHQKDKHVNSECAEPAAVPRRSNSTSQTRSATGNGCNSTYVQEQAAKILKEIAGPVKTEDFDDDCSDHHPVTRRGGKKRKSMPRKSHLLAAVVEEIDAAEEEDVTAAWQLAGGPTNDDEDDDDDTIIGDADDLAEALSPLQQDEEASDLHESEQNNSTALPCSCGGLGVVNSVGSGSTRQRHSSASSNDTLPCSPPHNAFDCHLHS